MTKKSPKTGFSLVELSIVALIVSALVAIIITAGRLSLNAKLTSAGTLTKSSPVSDIEGLVAWFETTMPQSLDDLSEDDGKAISIWRDLGPNRSNAIAGVAPTYAADSLNGLPTLRFNGGQYLLASGGETVSQLTTFVVMKFDPGATNCQFIIGSQGNWSSGAIHLESDCASPSRYPIYAPSNGSLLIGGTIAVDGNFHILSFGDNNASEQYIYVDGGNVTSSTPTNSKKNYSSYSIGAWYRASNNISRYLVGNIAEIIIFNRSLSNDERKDVEQYLGKKWSITVS